MLIGYWKLNLKRGQRCFQFRIICKEESFQRGMNDEKILHQASKYIVQEGILYRKSFSVPIQRCVAHDEAKRVLEKVHEAACDDHTDSTPW